MDYSYVEIEYVATSFSPARMDLAVKLLNTPVEEQIGGWKVDINWYTEEVEYVVVKTKYFIIVRYNSRFCLIYVQASVVYLANAPSQLSWEGILGKPKEEIRNLNGFEYMYLSNLKVPYFSTRPLYPLKLFPWAQHSSPPWQDLLCH